MRHDEADPARHLLAELDADEKLRLLHQNQPPVPRLGIEAFHTGQEALHGLAWTGEATVFPQAIGLAASWDPDLLHAVGDVVGNQARSFHHGSRPEVGLNLWAPVVDLLRDPRAGRNEEGYSEDPFLTGVLSTAYCRGLAGPDPERWWTAPTLKHFLAYNHENERVTSSADVRPRLLHEYYLRAFEPAIRSGAAKAVMLSYNLVNGRPCHLGAYIGILRSWAAELVVVSDAYAPGNLAGEQEYFPDHAQAHAAALRAGLDSFTDQGPDPEFTLQALRDAVQRGMVDQADVDRAVVRLLRLRTRLDAADPVVPPDPEPPPSEATGPSEPTVGAEGTIDSGWHPGLARRAVRESIVLLRNSGLLPLSTGGASAVRSAAVVGPLADEVFEDWYSGTLPYRSTPLSAIAQRLGEVSSATGHDRIRLAIGGTHPHRGEYEAQDWGDDLLTLRAPDGLFLTRTSDGRLAATAPQPHGWEVQETFRLLDTAGEPWRTYSDRTVASLEHVATYERYPVHECVVLADGVQQAAALAAESDVAIVLCGNHPLVGARETTDRIHLDLPGAQRRLLDAVAAANPATVLVVESGYPYALATWDGLLPAMLWMAHGGQEAGRGLADVLFGDVSPAGRLPQTWYGRSEELEPLGGTGEYDIIATGRTYLYERREPLFAFGHGLSYTRFAYANLRTEPASGGERLAVDVTNVGAGAGAEVVQFYARRLSSSRVAHPVRRLLGFERLELEPGETATSSVHLDPQQAFGIWDVRTGRFLVQNGRYELAAAASSRDTRVTLTHEPDGERLTPRDPTTAMRAADFDEHAGIRLCPDRPLHGDAVVASPGGLESWIDFHDLDFRHLRGTTVNLTVRATGPGRIALSTSTGSLLAEIELDDTEAVLRGRCTPPSGVKDIRIALKGSARLAEFWFERSQHV